MSPYDLSVTVLKVISDIGSVTAQQIAACIQKYYAIHDQYIAEITGHLIKIGLVAGSLREGELVFQPA
jgi:hypothetical protein